ncbi:MAG: HD domain-containing protein [Methylorubrum extorquens]|jgi:putative two-component system response regulator
MRNFASAITDDLAREVAAAVALVEEREREIVSTLMRAAEHRDADTGDHIARVSAYVGLVAEARGLSAADVRQISLAATMHDVGKIALPDAILLKPGPLTAEERRQLETHAERGQRILGGSASPVMRLAAEIAASHHERWDGAGYPYGLKGEAIPLSGRIVAVANVFDALTTECPYKQAWSLERARQHRDRERWLPLRSDGGYRVPEPLAPGSRRICTCGRPTKRYLLLPECITRSQNPSARNGSSLFSTF